MSNANNRTTYDPDVPRKNGAAKAARIDEGLAVLELLAKPGVPLTCFDIAAWCGCSDAMIQHIERQARKRLLERLGFGSACHRELGQELIDALSCWGQ